MITMDFVSGLPLTPTKKDSYLLTKVSYMESNASQSKERVGPVVPAPKFKRRAVSAVRDRPPGCGPTPEQNRQIAVVPSSKSVDSVESLVLLVTLSSADRAEGDYEVATHESFGFLAVRMFVGGFVTTWMATWACAGSHGRVELGIRIYTTRIPVSDS
ncbi:histone-lysine N-methyltransferase, H3 lysine-9 specific SUVH6-like [Gossypium australe]|uniref:Histone-lysine N-methyltransferase, H3 lysine-9 specific SUVH6-like n=1 Tax=Gossypium australe TaxID=47621 RepID=A0A5B6UZ93_9ROSI|nr:histone-lysine N-methyltransferase, H3 lysine-9 specific SUVH6-like [Gossypium australe]